MDKQVAHVTRGEYAQDFAQIIQIIEQNRSQAIQVINHASVLTAWQVGAYVSDKIKNAAWGSKVVQQLAEYIHTQNPTLKGWSKVTIYRMVQFYETYSSVEFLNLLVHLKLQKQIMPPKAAQIESKEIVSSEMTQLSSRPIVSFEMTQIPSVLYRTGWTNHQIIMRQCSLPEQCVFYILYAEYQKLQNKQLERAIKSDAYSRVLSDKKMQSAILKETYPQAEVLLKDKSILEFLGLPQRYKESKLRMRYALNRSVSPTMVSKYEEQLKVGSVIQRSLEEFVEFLNK